MFESFMKFSEYPSYIKYMAAGWVGYTAILVLLLIFAKTDRSEAQAPPQQVKEQSPPVEKLRVAQSPPREKGAKAMENGKPVINAPNGNVFYGTNSGTVNQNITNELPEPKFELRPISDKFVDGRYILQTLLVIDSKAPLKNLYVEANAPSIMTFDVTPQNSTMVVWGHSSTGQSGDKLTGKGFINIPNAFGNYVISVITRNRDKVDIVYNPEY